MSPLETRGVTREHVLMFAKVRVANGPEQHRVRIRDLSAQGVQTEGDVLGLKLEQKIEPDVVRRAIIGNDEGGYLPPWYVRGLGRERNCIGPTRKV